MKTEARRSHGNSTSGESKTRRSREKWRSGRFGKREVGYGHSTPAFYLIINSLLALKMGIECSLLDPPMYV